MLIFLIDIALVTAWEATFDSRGGSEWVNLY